MTYFLALSSTYDAIDIALLHNQKIQAQQSLSKYESTKKIIPEIAAILYDNNLCLDDISAIIAHQGPAPFTTLRTVIATINGISLAKNIPLIGVNGIVAFLHEHTIPETTTVALLNAFSNEVFYAYQETGSVQYGCMDIDKLLSILFCTPNKKQYRFIGNGTELYREKIEIHCDTFSITIPETTPNCCSIKQICSVGYEQWHKQSDKTYQLLPLYLKKAAR